jgi:pimeloyl-ACP methyl ester carboxylesterase
MTAPTTPIELRHGHVTLALHRVRAGDGHALLLLHGLGEHTRPDLPPYFERWPGPIWGLDFTGHGASSVPVGGGYTAEILLADANVALTHIGEATVFGRGLGAWIALLLAGARPTRVRGAILFDGPGLVGGGTEPGSSFVIEPPSGARGGPDRPTPDPFAVAELVRDVRPPDYAATFVRFAVEGSDLPEPITVSTVARPEWLAGVAAEPGVADLPVEEALALYSSAGSSSVATT